MEKQAFQILHSRVGTKFLQYVLNLNEPIDRYSDILSLSLEPEQRQALSELQLIVNSSAQSKAAENYDSIIPYLHLHTPKFNAIRAQCGGSIQTRHSGKALLDFLLKRAIESYACLLILETENLILDQHFDHREYFPSSKHESELIFKYIKEDRTLSMLLTEKEYAFGSGMNYLLENSFFTECFIYAFVGQFLLRSFKNCCFRINYTLDALLNEIENQYSCLEKIASKERIEFSCFRGAHGLLLLDCPEFILSEKLIIRNISEVNNPIIKHTISNTHHQAYGAQILGCVIEFRDSTLSKGKVATAGTPITEDYSESFALFECCLTAIILCRQSTCAPIKFTFFDKGTPFNRTHPQVKRDLSTDVTILSKSEISEVQSWFELLSKIDLTWVEITLNRIKSSLYNREFQIDSIIDAFIAWESMFSSEISTTSSVTKSISKMLKKSEYKISNKRLVNLYSLRSSIIHGKPEEHKLIKCKDVTARIKKLESIKIEVIEISIVVLKELVKDKTLLYNSPSKRVEILLNPVKEFCECCKKNSYKFS
jgi:hypothetical protein